MACKVATETEMHVKVPALISRAHPLNIPFNDLGPQCSPNFAGIQQPCSRTLRPKLNPQESLAVFLVTLMILTVNQVGLL